MKLYRLVGIISLLLQKEAMTAPELAAYFEVSRRTIQRDIDALCMAGIPLVTRQGAHGGISIDSHYKLDKTLLTKSELQDILAGLRGLDSVNGTNRYGQLMDKLWPGSSDLLVGDQSILINLSSWYKPTLAYQIALIRQAIENTTVLQFTYYAPSGDSLRCIEPYYLIFQWSSWYVWGWCQMRDDFRLFKLNRMNDLEMTGQLFVKRAVKLPDLSNERIFSGGDQVKVVFEPTCKWRLVDEFGPESFKTLPDGKLLFQAYDMNREHLLSWLITFRDQAEIIEPPDLVKEMQQCLLKMCQKYDE